MHQPDYRDSNGVISMPWVFLHAIKDYYDMLWIVSLHSGANVTFNITPTLIEQLEMYKRGCECDRFIRLLLKDVDMLTLEERAYLNKLCRTSNVETMVKPLRGYAELFGMGSLEGKQLRDLEVFYLLSWCGTYLRKYSDIIASLLNKGGSFSEDDKAELVEELLKFVEGILPYYGRLYSEGRIELSTTPYAHPILPLLIDVNEARAANPLTVTPDNAFSLADDALLHVERSKEVFAEVFGGAPRGFWPAEGGVSERAVNMLHKMGGEWCATDEAVFFRSIGVEDRTQLYKPCVFNGMRLFFRDRVLSDRVGFVYKMWSEHKAVEDFVEYVGSLNSGSLITCILDGENPWEFYPDNGFGFLNALYSRVSGEFDMVKLGDVGGEYVELEHLAPGSWINGDFSTWIGHPEKNRAWEILFDTRRDYMRHKQGGDDDVINHFLVAECSDWYWWYGDDHATSFKVEFDTLFRSHLVAVYKAIGVNPPANLLVPIVRNRKTVAYINKPKFPISPVINGVFDSFFEWLGAGVVDEARWFSTMDARFPIKRLYYGCDDRNVYVALEGDVESIARGRIIVIVGDSEKSIVLPVSRQLVRVYPKDDRCVAIVSREVVEMSIDRRLFGTAETARLRMEVEVDGSVIQILPGFGYLEINLKEDYARNWFV